MARRSARAQAQTRTSSAGPWWPAAVLFGLSLGAVFLAGLGARLYVVFDRAAFFTGVAGAVAAAVLLYRAAPLSRLTRLSLAWVAFLVWSLVCVAFSGRVWSALVGEVTSGLGWATLVALTLVALASTAVAPAMRRVLVGAGWYVVLVQCAVTAWELSNGLAPGGTLSNSTYLGELLLMLLPWVVVGIEARPTWERRARAATVVFALATLAASGSRLALVLALIWGGWYLFRHTALAARAKWLLAAAAVIGIVVAGVAFSRAEAAASFSASTLGERPQLYRMGVDALAARPIVGWGPDGYFAGAMATSTPADALARRIIALMPAGFDPHNLLLLIAVSTGLVGLTLFGWFAAEVVRRWRTSVPDAPDIAPAVWATAMPLVIFLTAPSVLHVLVLFAIVVGLSLVASAEEPTVAVGVPAPARVAVVVGLALVCALFAANMATRAAFENAGAELSPPLAASSMSASALWSGDARLAYLSALHLGYASAGNPAIAQNRLDLQALQRAVRLDRRMPVYPLEQARTLAYYQQPAEVTEDAFREALSRYPAYPEGNAEYALFLARIGRLEEARSYLGLAEVLDDLSPERRLAIDATKKLLAAP